MSALAHYFEEEGLATTAIALVRHHAERIRPPRALWVPFELGRPLGAPDEPDFQKRVLRAALACHTGMATFAEAGVSDSDAVVEPEA